MHPEDIDLQAVYDDQENLLWIDEPFYDIVQKKNEFRGMERREFLVRFGLTGAAVLFGLRPQKAQGGITTINLAGTASNFSVIGDQVYSTSGTYTWTVPSGVTSICVVCVVCVAGGGAGGYGGAGSYGGYGTYAGGVGTTGGTGVNGGGNGGTGGGGAVRIMWGSGRSFPSSAT